MRWLGFVPARSQTGKRPEEDAPAQIRRTDGWIASLSLSSLFSRAAFFAAAVLGAPTIIHTRGAQHVP